MIPLMHFNSQSCNKAFSFIFSFFMFNSYTLWGIWPFSSQDPQEKFTCKMSTLGGTVPDDVCVLRDFIKKVKEANENHSEIKKEDKVVNAWLFYGNHGVGKTTGACSIAEEAVVETIFHDSREISMRIEETHNPAGVITDIFEAAHKKSLHKPIVLVIDEIDRIVRKHPESIDIIYSSFRTLMDKYANRTLMDKYAKNSNLVIVFTSNQTYQLDEGFSGRCAQVEWFVPNDKNRKQILLFHAHHRSTQLSEKFVNAMVAETANFSGRQIFHAFECADRLAKRDNKKLDEECIKQGIMIEKEKLNKKQWEQQIESAKWYLEKAGKPLAAVGSIAALILYILKGGKDKK